MSLEIVPDNPSEMELVLEILRNMWLAIERMDATLKRYEPLLKEAERRMSGPLSFGKRK